MTMPAPAFTQEVIALIQHAKQRAAVAVNSEITLLHWHIGQRINQEVLGGERADYGKQVVANLAKQLTTQFGKGWSAQQLRHCMKFAECYADEQIVSALRRKLSWTHIKALIYIDDPLKRDFYAQMAITEGWSTRTLDERIGALLYERTAISKKPDETIRAELLELDKSGIHVAEYLTVLPPLEVLKQRLHLATETAKQRLAHSDALPTDNNKD